jgi:hypothetical protein
MRKILFLAANPQQTSRLYLDDELAEELYSHTNKIRKCYQEYRFSVKKKLTV